MPMQISKAAATAVALAVLATGCGSDDETTAPSASATTATTASASAISQLAGEYRRTLTKADLARTEGFRNEGAGQQRPEPGPLALTLSDGALKFVDLEADVTIRQDFSATSDGAFRIGAYQQPEQGAFCGPDVSQTASYTWKASGDVLTLKANEDTCADRNASLTGDWKRR